MLDKPGPAALRVAYCGPIARPDRPARGGYELANRRLVDDLRLRGVEVIEMPYAAPSGSQPVKILAYTLGFAATAIDMVRKRRRYDLLHLTPLYRQFFYAEALLCVLAWALGKRVALDIRAGSFVIHYRQRSSLYRALADALLGRTEMVTVEGRDYLPFMRERRAGPVLYLPNYVKASATEAATAPEREGAPMRLVFLSRVVPEKGVEMAIGTLGALLAMGVPARLEIIGSGDDAYVGALAARSRDLPVTWSGPLAPGEVVAHLAAAHFFVFPTFHRGEGHSNALTEAMAEGVVPVCSDSGFNRCVAGEAGLVLPAIATATDYASALRDIGTGPAWRSLSEKARARIAQRFTSEAVLPDLIASYHAAIAGREPALA